MNGSIVIWDEVSLKRRRRTRTFLLWKLAKHIDDSTSSTKTVTSSINIIFIWVYNTKNIRIMITLKIWFSPWSRISSQLAGCEYTFKVTKLRETKSHCLVPKVLWWQICSCLAKYWETFRQTRVRLFIKPFELCNCLYQCFYKHNTSIIENCIVCSAINTA